LLAAHAWLNLTALQFLRQSTHMHNVERDVHSRLHRWCKRLDFRHSFVELPVASGTVSPYTNDYIHARYNLFGTNLNTITFLSTGIVAMAAAI
jgi:hypothetical protein